MDHHHDSVCYRLPPGDKRRADRGDDTSVEEALVLEEGDASFTS